MPPGPIIINRYMQWPLDPNQGDVFTSPAGNVWVFDGCGWVSTCCPPAVICDPEISGISVIYSQKKGSLIYGYGVSYFTWNSNLNRYEGFIMEPMVIEWTGSQWKFIISRTGLIVATSSTANILEAVFVSSSPEWANEFSIAQIECGLVYSQLCVDTRNYGIMPIGISETGPYTLYPSEYDSIADIINGSQAVRYNGWDSNGNDVAIFYDSAGSEWLMYENAYYATDWTINAAPNQNALILGSEWLSTNGQVGATFTLGECATECYPNRDGITLMYNDGKWNPIYLTWDPGNQYYFTDNQYINELFGWYSVSVEYIGTKVSISVDLGAGLEVVGSNTYYGSFNERLFNHSWIINPKIGDGFDVYCGDVGCSRMCATFKGSTTTMVPWGYASLEDLIACTNKFNGWVGWNGTDETIRLSWDDGGPTYFLSIPIGNANQDIGVDSYTSAALIANSPYAYNQGGLSGTLALTSGDC
jgi:hypothetical protein